MEMQDKSKPNAHNCKISPCLEVFSLDWLGVKRDK